MPFALAWAMWEMVWLRKSIGEKAMVLIVPLQS
jgi:hypothetical protein